MSTQDELDRLRAAGLIFRHNDVGDGDWFEAGGWRAKLHVGKFHVLGGPEVDDSSGFRVYQKAFGIWAKGAGFEGGVSGWGPFRDEDIEADSLAGAVDKILAIYAKRSV